MRRMTKMAQERLAENFIGYERAPERKYYFRCELPVPVKSRIFDLFNERDESIATLQAKILEDIKKGCDYFSPTELEHELDCIKQEEEAHFNDLIRQEEEAHEKGMFMPWYQRLDLQIARWKKQRFQPEPDPGDYDDDDEEKDYIIVYS